MGRKLRYAEPGSIVHITGNTVYGRYALRPCDDLNVGLAGQLRKYQKVYGMDIIVEAVMSTHFHLMLEIQNQTQCSDYMRDVQAGFARVVHDVQGVTGPIFDGPYEMSVLGNEHAVMEAYTYILANSTKEDLVRSPRHWPGLHSADELCGGRPVIGEYFDTHAYEAAKTIDPRADPKLFIVREPVALTPIPAFRHMTRHQRETANRKLVQQIVNDCEVKRGAKPVFGREKILAIEPNFIPETTKRSKVPGCWAGGPNRKQVIQDHWAAYRASVAAYYAALQAFICGDHDVEFPEGCYLPLMVRIARTAAAPAASASPVEPTGQAP